MKFTNSPRPLRGHRPSAPDVLTRISERSSAFCSLPRYVDLAPLTTVRALRLGSRTSTFLFPRNFEKGHNEETVRRERSRGIRHHRSRCHAKSTGNNTGCMRDLRLSVGGRYLSLFSCSVLAHPTFFVRINHRILPDKHRHHRYRHRQPPCSLQPRR